MDTASALTGRSERVIISTKTHVRQRLPNFFSLIK